MKLAEFVTTLNSLPDHEKYAYSLSAPGPKYTRVVQIFKPGPPDQRAVYCFVDHDGNIYKAASWKSPAPGIRTTLDTVNMAQVDPHGGWLYR